MPKRRSDYEGLPCRRKKPCTGHYRKVAERGKYAITLWVFRCDVCGKKATSIIRNVTTSE